MCTPRRRAICPLICSLFLIRTLIRIRSQIHGMHPQQVRIRLHAAEVPQGLFLVTSDPTLNGRHLNLTDLYRHKSAHAIRLAGLRCSRTVVRGHS